MPSLSILATPVLLGLWTFRLLHYLGLSVLGGIRGIQLICFSLLLLPTWMELIPLYCQRRKRRRSPGGGEATVQEGGDNKTKKNDTKDAMDGNSSSSNNNNNDGTFTVHRGIQYGPYVRNDLDVYFIEENEEEENKLLLEKKLLLIAKKKLLLRPVIILVSGGAWVIGYKLWSLVFAHALVHYPSRNRKHSSSASSSSPIVISIDYRNFPQAKISAMIEDIDTAIEYVLTTLLPLYKGDPNRVYVAGQSAGAHLVACALLERGVRVKQQQQQQQQQHQQLQRCNSEDNCNTAPSPSSPQIQAISSQISATLGVRHFFGISGPYDLLQIASKFARQGLGFTLLHTLFEADFERYSPSRYVKTLASALLLSEADMQVQQQQQQQQQQVKQEQQKKKNQIAEILSQLRSHGLEGTNDDRKCITIDHDDDDDADADAEDDASICSHNDTKELKDFAHQRGSSIFRSEHTPMTHRRRTASLHSTYVLPSSPTAAAAANTVEVAPIYGARSPTLILTPNRQRNNNNNNNTTTSSTIINNNNDSSSSTSVLPASALKKSSSSSWSSSLMNAAKSVEAAEEYFHMEGTATLSSVRTKTYTLIADGNGGENGVMMNTNAYERNTERNPHKRRNVSIASSIGGSEYSDSHEVEEKEEEEEKGRDGVSADGIFSVACLPLGYSSTSSSSLSSIAENDVITTPSPTNATIGSHRHLTKQQHEHFLPSPSSSPSSLPSAAAKAIPHPSTSSSLLLLPFPNCTLFHGDADTVVPASASLLFAEALVSSGVATRKKGEQMMMMVVPHDEYSARARSTSGSGGIRCKGSAGEKDGNERVEFISSQEEEEERRRRTSTIRLDTSSSTTTTSSDVSVGSRHPFSVSLPTVECIVYKEATHTGPILEDIVGGDEYLVRDIWAIIERDDDVVGEEEEEEREGLKKKKKELLLSGMTLTENSRTEKTNKLSPLRVFILDMARWINPF